jgi:hypothetical protein
MSLENPFFVREVRAYSRKAWSPLSWQVLAAAMGPGFWLWAIAREWTPDAPGAPYFLRGLLLAWVIVSHAVVCGFTGWRLGAQAFGAEQRQSTLEGLQLVSTSSWKWSTEKLLFPLYSLFLVWLAAFPGCAMLVVRGHCLPATLWPGLLLAAAVGVLSFGVALMGPPERAGLPLSTERQLPLAQRLELSAPRLIATWLGWEILQLGIRWLEKGVRDLTPDFQTRLLFRILPLRSDQIFAGMLGLFLFYGLTCAWAWANPASPIAGRLRRAALLVTLVTGYALVVGVTWIGSNWFWQSLLVAVPTVQLLRLALAQRKSVRVRRAARPDSPRAVREIAAVQARWDNPVLVRDLRVSLRGGGLLSSILWHCLIVGALGGAFGAYALSMGAYYVGASTYPVIAGFLASLYGWGAFAAVMRIGMSASTQWSSERRMKTVSQLLLSPIPGVDIVRGRWAAALLQGSAVAMPWVVSFAICTIIASGGERLETLVCYSLWIVSLALILSAGRAGAIRELTGRREWLSPARASLAWFFAQPFFLVMMASRDSSGGMTGLALCIVLTLLNVGMVPALLNWSGYQIDHYRARLAESSRGA